MELSITYDSKNHKINFTKSDIFPNQAWSTLRTILENSQNEVLDELNDGKTIICEVNSLEQCLRGNGLRSLRDRYSFEINFDEETTNLIRTYLENQKKVQTIKNLNKVEDVDENIIVEKIKKNGFNKYELKDHQLRALNKIIALGNGANFSVPGSGKTAVTLAAHLYFQDRFDSLIVICPKNAFLAWDENIQDFLDDDHPLKTQKLTRLVGSQDDIKNLLISGKKNFIVNYQRIESIVDDLRIFLQNNKTHLVLDESHKVKNYQASVTRSVLRLSSYPINKQILSGTPMPKSITDIVSQFDFLHGAGLSNEIISTYSNAQDNFSRLRNFFVRTKKKDLKLKKPIFIPENIKMSDGQMALYTSALDPLLRLNTQGGNLQNIARLRRSLMRLIAISSNPQITFQRWLHEDIDAELTDNVESKIVEQIISEGYSNKIKRAIEIARSNAEKNEKTIIWSFFKYNVELIANELSDLDAEYIHGSVETGDDNDLDTREGKIKKFKNDDNCKVLVANYAACAEGISLQHACNTAVYIDRSYQLEQFLQSIDRIHRIGNNDQKYIYILKSTSPSFVTSIDQNISVNLERKERDMGNFLLDEDLIGLADDEINADDAFDETIDEKDVRSIIDEITKQN